MPPSSSTLLSTPSSLHQTLTSFLTIWTHHILFLRSLYPSTSFLPVRAYNYPVRQSRHPDVCAWINSAIAAISHQLTRSTVRRVALCIYSVERNATLERWVVDVCALPVVERGELDTPFAEEEGEGEGGRGGERVLSTKLNVADLEAQFRAVLVRLDAVCARLRELPGKGEGECSFTLAVEVREEADRPVGRMDEEERKWVAAEPGPFEGDKEQGRRVVPVRRLEAGELRMELLVEEMGEKLLGRDGGGGP